MDMMALRRRVMAQMANGANFVKGTFTVQSNAGRVTINIGKTFSKYMFFTEMTDASKTALLQTGETSARTFFVEGVYPNPSVNNVQAETRVFVCRVTPSTGELTYTQLGSLITGIDGTHIEFLAGSISNITAFYTGYSYDYYVVEIK